MLREQVAHFWDALKQKSLFALGEEVGPLTPTLERLIQIWEVLRIEEKVKVLPGNWALGRPMSSRRAIARAFVAKSYLNLPTTVALIDRLAADTALRRLCGFERRKDVPSEATFSRAFAEFTENKLGQQAHEALVRGTYGEGIVGHVSRDSTAIDAREKPLNKQANQEESAPRKRGRPRKGEQRPAPAPTRLEKQSRPGMSLMEMHADLPKAADVGSKQNAKGFLVSWKGYKLHLDVCDTGMPLSAILTSASVHDSQVAIPLMKTTAERTGTVLYELMDSAYDAPLIHAASRDMGRIPIIDIHPRRNADKKAEKSDRALLKTLGLPLAEDVRYNERTTVERANARLKDEFGAGNLRVKGPAKAMCHLMFGVCVLAADTLLRLVA
jgi:Transposase DDE domain/Transposase domain (DUF772)